MTRASLLRRFLGEEGGAALMEFAIVALVFFTLMFFLIEYGLIMMTKIAIESATQRAARCTAIDGTNTPDCKAMVGAASRVEAIKALIADKTGGIVNPKNVLVTSTIITAASESAPVEPDVCLVGTNPYVDPCGPVTVAHPHGTGPFSDNNGVPDYQPNGINAGETNDLVQISVFYTWQVMFPLMKPFFKNGVYKMTSTTLVKNEPF